MGFKWSQHCCLKLRKEQGSVLKKDLELGKEYLFRKKGYRLYSLDTPIELITSNWRVIARVIITEITAGKGETKGKFKVLKIYTGEEEKIVSGTIIPYTEINQS